MTPILRPTIAEVDLTKLMRNLQKEWKTVGPVIHKLSDELWQQFTAICDQFFEKKVFRSGSFHSTAALAEASRSSESQLAVSTWSRSQ